MEIKVPMLFIFVLAGVDRRSASCQVNWQCVHEPGEWDLALNTGSRFPSGRKAFLYHATQKLC